MLKLSGTLRNASSRLAPMSSSWRIPLQQLSAACSGAANPSPALAQIKEEESQAAKKSKSKKSEMPTSKNPMIQAAFDTLKISRFGPQDANVEDSIIGLMKTSANVRGLLKMVDNKSVTPENAYAVVTLLIDWVNNGKAKLSDFELDDRFLHLCDLISCSKKQKDQSSQKKSQSTKKYLDELNLFYGINEIDEATKEVANITVKQMIKVMSALAQQKRRTTPLLRSLSYNISRSSDVLNIKQLSDLLYSMSVLNYPDDVLLQKVSDDLMRCVSFVDKSAVIGSILTSLGILRYKNEQLMDELSTWVVEHSQSLRPQDLCSFFMTLAMLGYRPSNVESIKTILIEPLKESDTSKPAEWLDIVWALTVLQLAENRHIESVLKSTFIADLTEAQNVSVPKRHKLLNINGAAQFLAAKYDGPLLDSNSELFVSPIQRSKEKQLFVRSVTSAIANIFPPPDYLKLDINFGMGFLLDAEFCIDNTGERIPVDSNLKITEGFRIAVIPLCYNDYCRGQQDPVGFHKLNFRILEAKGYKILSIPHTEYSTEDKIVQRVLYIKNRIKNMVMK